MGGVRRGNGNAFRCMAVKLAEAKDSNMEILTFEESSRSVEAFWTELIVPK
jgi:hypothetical protein